MPLALLGVYGISRSIADLTSGFALQLSNSVIFPFIARHARGAACRASNEVTLIRQTLLLIAAIGFAVAAALVDLAIHIVFDQRYHAAGWMAPLLILWGMVFNPVQPQRFDPARTRGAPLWCDCLQRQVFVATGCSPFRN